MDFPHVRGEHTEIVCIYVFKTLNCKL